MPRKKKIKASIPDEHRCKHQKKKKKKKYEQHPSNPDSTAMDLVTGGGPFWFGDSHIQRHEIRCLKMTVVKGNA